MKLVLVSLEGPKSLFNIGRHRKSHLQALLGAMGGVERGTAVPRAVPTTMRSPRSMALIGNYGEVLLHR